MYTRSDRHEVAPLHLASLTATPVEPPPYPQVTYNLYTVVTESTVHREHLISDSEGSHTTFKNCEHYKVHSTGGTAGMFGSVNCADNGLLHVFNVSDPYAFYQGEFGTAGEFNANLPDFYTPRFDGGFVPEPNGLDSLLQNALSSMMPKIKSELSLVNTLIELKDLATFRSTVEGVASLAKKLLLRRDVPLSSIFRTQADVYLQYKFNIATLVSDIRGIYRSLANHEKRINALIARSGRVRVSHFSKTLTESGLPNDTEQNNGGGNAIDGNQAHYPIRTVFYSSRQVFTDPASFHVQVKYNFNYTAYQLEHARVLALLDSLGVNLNASIIWNAIPWSFVVDWFIGIGRYLDSFKVANMDPKINILQCLWSIKRSRRIIVSGHSVADLHFFNPGKYPPSYYVRPIVYESAYRRQVFYPSSGSVQLSGLSPTEFSLGAALILSRRRRPTRARF